MAGLPKSPLDSACEGIAERAGGWQFHDGFQFLPAAARRDPFRPPGVLIFKAMTSSHRAPFTEPQEPIT